MAVPPGCRVDIYWYQDLRGEAMKNQRTLHSKSTRFCRQRCVKLGSVLASGTETVMWTDEEMQRAEEEDRILRRILDEDSNRPPRPMSTPESIAAGEAAIAEVRARAAETLARRIENK